MQTKKKRKKPEEQLQMNLVTELKLRLKKGVIYWHTPSEGARHVCFILKLYEMGFRPGVSDLLFYYQGQLYALELKAGYVKATDDQIVFLDDIAGQGAKIAVCTGYDAAIKKLEEWDLLR